MQVDVLRHASGRIAPGIGSQLQIACYDLSTCCPEPLMLFLCVRIACLLFLVFACLSSSPAFAVNETALVTGNGHGFAVFSLQSKMINKLYAHPYKFERENPREILGEGVETANLVKNLRWVSAGSSEKIGHYLNESHIIEVDTPDAKEHFFMPFGFEHNALVATCEPISQKDSTGDTDSATASPSPRLELDADWQHAIADTKQLSVDGRPAKLYKFQSVAESLLVVPLTSKTERSKPKFGNHSDFLNCNTWVFIVVENASDASSLIKSLVIWQNNLVGAQLVQRELRSLESWRARPRVTFNSENERKLWRQSEVVLRMAQSREPNRPGRYNNGLIIASLPDGAWFVPWVRDMAYGVYALIRMGHIPEARMALKAYLNARPVGRMAKEVGGPYQISVVRYFGNGAEEPYFTMEGATNIEYDDWGLVLWVLGEYVDRSKDFSILAAQTYRGPVYYNAKKFIVDPLLANLEKYDNGLIVKADTSIWEERQKDKKHFAFSTAAAIVGLEKFASLAQMQHDGELRNKLLEKVALLKIGFNKAFIKDGKLRGTLESGIKNEVDGAMLSAINWKIVNDPAVINASVKAMDRLKMPSGGYRRVTSIIEDPAIFEYWYERQEFLFINFSLAEVYLRMKPPAVDKANQLVSTMVERSSRDNFIVPEMYVSEKNYRFTGEIGEPTGAVPMVGYGAGAFIVYLCHREDLIGASAH